MNSRMWVYLLAAAIPLAGTGCKSLGIGRSASDAKEIERFLKSGRDPKTLALTIYQDAGEKWIVVNGDRVRPHQRAQSSFVSPPGSSLAVIGAEGPRGSVHVLMDPSSAQSWTSMAFARDLQLIPVTPPALTQVPVHLVDTQAGVLSLCPALKLDRMDAEAVCLYARPGPPTMWPVCRSADARDVKVVLGFDFLRSLAWAQWDFEGRMWMASSSDSYVADENRVIAILPFEAGADNLTVRAIIDGQPRQVILDLAGDFEMAMEAPPVDLIRQITLDNAVLRDVRAVSSHDVGLGRPDIVRIGARLLSRFQVTLDFHRNAVILEVPAGAAAEGAAEAESAAPEPETETPE